MLIVTMPVLKRYKKIGETVDPATGRKKWITEKQTTQRCFPINLTEPLIPELFSYMQGRAGRLFDITRIRAYQVITRTDPRIYPHWFRAQRASQLAYEYGFDVHDLMDFFGWLNVGTAIHYSRMGWKGLAAKMLAKTGNL